jgi:hypothetical protein
MANAPNPNRNAGNPPDAVLMIVYGVCFGVFGVPYFALMGYGGQRMRKLSSRPFWTPTWRPRSGSAERSVPVRGKTTASGALAIRDPLTRPHEQEEV